MIEAESLCWYYEGDVQVAAVRDVTLKVAAGERVSIVGRRGSGKTTLINLLTGMDSASDGLLKVAGQIVSQLVRRQMAAYRLQTVGTIVFRAIVAACCERAAWGAALDVTLVNFSGRLMRVHAV